MNTISIIYNLIILPFLSFLFPIIKLLNKKFKEREGCWEELLENFNFPKTNKRIWFHAASMGEFEQAKPIIEFIKKHDYGNEIIVTFFSPSGLNNQKNYEFADYILYLPFDFKSNVKYFINKIQPDIAIFVRYEIWRNYLEILNKNKIPIYLICATKPNSKILYHNTFLKKFTISNYNYFTRIYTISKEYSDFFEKLGVKTQIVTSSDTRYDRIYEKVLYYKEHPILPKKFFQNHFVLIGGSTWEQDEEILIETIIRLQKNENINIKLVLVPHEPIDSHINTLKRLLPHSFLLSEITNQLFNIDDENIIINYLGNNHIIVDSIGKLLGLYSLADLAFIGGGFGAGIHSVTEAAGYGIPIACGPKYKNSFDAEQLRISGSLEIIKNTVDLYNWVKDLYYNKENYKRISKINENYILDKLGESQKIAEDIIKIINL